MPEETKRQSYSYNGETVRFCKDCDTEIFFVANPKTGKNMPVERNSLEPHWAKCPGAAKFRKGGRKS